MSSRNGTTIGGWLTIRYSPSTSSASLDSACRLSRVCAFCNVFSAVFAALSSARSALSGLALRALLALPFAPFLPSCRGARRATVARIEAMMSSSSRWAYQTSIVPICAKPAIASR